MIVEYLYKRGGARFTNVDTYKVSCEQNKLIGKETLKSAKEVDEEDFVHVIRSVLTEYKEPVVVKVHEHGNYFVVNELNMLNKLSDYNRVVQKLCDFKCKDSKSRWMDRAVGNMHFCDSKGNDMLHFIVMEYIPDGDISKRLPHASFEELRSFFLQSALVLCELAYNFKVYHGDLNTGNILIEKTNKKTATYIVKDTTFNVKTYGVAPKLIDFGRGGEYKGKVRDDIVLNDIYILLSVLSRWIMDKGSRKTMEEFILKESSIKKNKVLDFLANLESFHITLGTPDRDRLS